MKIQRICTCTSPDGFTALDAAMIAKIADDSSCEVALEVNGKSCDAGRLIELLSMSIVNGDFVTVTAEGRNASDAVRNIEAVFCPDGIREVKLPHAGLCAVL